MFVGGFLFSFDFLRPGKNIRSPRQLVLTIAGVLALSYVALSFYGFAHNEMRDSVFFCTFWWAKRVVLGTSLVMLVLMLLMHRKKSVNAES